VITARGGADAIAAGAGNDRLIVSYSALTSNVTGDVTGNLAAGYDGTITDAGANTINFSGTENFTITTGSGNDLITTGGGIDVLRGGSGNDRLNSGAGQDTLTGDQGADVITGGLGLDRMSGGAGADRFRFTALADSPTSILRDHITDFEQGGDKLSLVAIDADPLAAGNQAFDFLGTSGFTGAGSEVRYSQVSGITRVSTDTDGDKVADFVFQLDDPFALTANDFLL
jgi:serralysin